VLYRVIRNYANDSTQLLSQ